MHCLIARFSPIRAAAGRPSRQRSVTPRAGNAAKRLRHPQKFIKNRERGENCPKSRRICLESQAARIAPTLKNAYINGLVRRNCELVLFLESPAFFDAFHFGLAGIWRIPRGQTLSARAPSHAFSGRIPDSAYPIRCATAVRTVLRVASPVATLARSSGETASKSLVGVEEARHSPRKVDRRAPQHSTAKRESPEATASHHGNLRRFQRFLTKCPDFAPRLRPHDAPSTSVTHRFASQTESFSTMAGAGEGSPICPTPRCPTCAFFAFAETSACLRMRFARPKLLFSPASQWAYHRLCYVSLFSGRQPEYLERSQPGPL
jgi:hypothetical protein